MKRIFLISAMALFAMNTSFAQEVSKKPTKTKTLTATKSVTPAKADVAPKSEGAGLIFENETIDYGVIQHNADGKREFVFTNNGTEPLVISNAQGSCGCTVPTWPKEPIAPGAKGVIGVKYATDRVGKFTKNVTLTTNAVNNTSKVLTIKGEILPDPTPATPVAAPTKS
ncbi:MAG: DUF1573 domain-containing protein [Flavobacterium sp.]|nr:DUF1573 domain-containing protein [Flavobacterium sp.]